MKLRRIDSPVGAIVLRVDAGALVAADFVDSPSTAPELDDDPVLETAALWFEDYLAGRQPSSKLPLKPAGTVFEHRVWDELVKIPYGGTTSYGELARRLGDAKLARAVGIANSRNPIAVIIPCHRVIGASGDLVGYAGGLHRKRWLLDHEAGPSRQGQLFS